MKATTVTKISLYIVVMYRNKTNTKENKKERNKALDPDLNEKQERMAENIENYFYDIIPKYQ
jgi:hypothetical protein